MYYLCLEKKGKIVQNSKSENPPVSQFREVFRYNVSFNDQAVHIVDDCIFALKAVGSELVSQGVEDLSKNERLLLIDKVQKGFYEKGIGYQKLVKLVYRDLVCRALRSLIPNYSKAMLSEGCSPEDYFNEKYLPYFENFGLPIRELSKVDASLYSHLSSLSSLSTLSRTLEKSAAPTIKSSNTLIDSFDYSHA